MNEPCACVRPLLDGLADGEVDAARLRAHLDGCAGCRAELDALRALKARLSRLRLPAPPRAARLFRPRRAPWAAAAAAAALLALLLSLAAPPPLAALSRFHDDVLRGRVVLSNLGLGTSTTPSDGPCPCPASLGASSPFVVYRSGGAAISLLALDERAPAPEVARLVGGNTLLMESRHGLRLIWISRLDVPSLRRAVERLRPPPGLSLREFSCAACCALAEGRGDGPVSMELLVAEDGGPIDPARIDALRPAPLAHK